MTLINLRRLSSFRDTYKRCLSCTLEERINRKNCKENKCILHFLPKDNYIPCTKDMDFLEKYFHERYKVELSKLSSSQVYKDI